MRTFGRLLAVLLLGFALVSCSDDDGGDAATDDATDDTSADDGSGDDGGEVTGSLEASDQDSDGTTLTVDTVSIDGSPGWVSVHADLDGAPGPIIGNAEIPEGESTDVEVTFDEPQESGTYWPMLHVDAGEVGTYEFPDGPDVPVTADGEVVVVPIELTVG